MYKPSSPTFSPPLLPPKPPRHSLRLGSVGEPFKLPCHHCYVVGGPLWGLAYITQTPLWWLVSQFHWCESPHAPTVRPTHNPSNPTPVSSVLMKAKSSRYVLQETSRRTMPPPLVLYRSTANQLTLTDLYRRGRPACKAISIIF